MEKKTFVPERKAYLAPAAKSHFIQVEENIMSGDDYQYGGGGYYDGNTTNENGGY